MNNHKFIIFPFLRVVGLGSMIAFFVFSGEVLRQWFVEETFEVELLPVLFVSGGLMFAFWPFRSRVRKNPSKM